MSVAMPVAMLLSEHAHTPYWAYWWPHTDDGLELVLFLVLSSGWLLCPLEVVALSITNWYLPSWPCYAMGVLVFLEVWSLW